jgi:hypothetical protein
VIRFYDEAGNVIENARARGRVQRAVSAVVRRFGCLLLSAAKVDGLYYLPALRDSIILILRVRQKSVAGQEFARPRTGASITG